jgi:hypothetical protein
VAPAEYAAYGLPSPAESDQAGALLLTARDGYAFSAAAGRQVVADASEGSVWTHGYVSSDPDLQAIFIASGRGITPGATLDSVNTIDLAPTMARAAGDRVAEGRRAGAARDSYGRLSVPDGASDSVARQWGLVGMPLRYVHPDGDWSLTCPQGDG